MPLSSSLQIPFIAALAAWTIHAPAEDTLPAFQPIARAGYAFWDEPVVLKSLPAPKNSLIENNSTPSSTSRGYGLRTYFVDGSQPLDVDDTVNSYQYKNGLSGVLLAIGRLDSGGTFIGRITSIEDLVGYLDSLNAVPVIETEREITSLELAKQHVFFASDGGNAATTGWRFEAYHDDWQAVVGEEVRGIWKIDPEALGSISLKHIHNALKATRSSVYGTTGLRGIHHQDEFYFQGIGSILGRTTVEQTIDHYAIGPQLGLGIVAEASMFRFEAVALGLVGYGRVETRLRGVFGQTTHSRFTSDEEHVAWHGETRLTGSCQLTQRLRFDATWRWFVTGPAYDAAGSVAWNAPDFGFNQTPSDRLYSSDWFLGLTYTH